MEKIFECEKVYFAHILRLWPGLDSVEAAAGERIRLYRWWPPTSGLRFQAGAARPIRYLYIMKVRYLDGPCWYQSPFERHPERSTNTPPYLHMLGKVKSGKTDTPFLNLTSCRRLLEPGFLDGASAEIND